MAAGAPDAHDADTRCRLCTANDFDGLIEELASSMWERHREREFMGPWAAAGPHWQRTMREFAEATIATLQQRP